MTDVDITPRGWSGHSTDQIAAVLARIITDLNVKRVTATRHQILIDVRAPLPGRPATSVTSPEQIEALRVELAKLGPFKADLLPKMRFREEVEHV